MSYDFNNFKKQLTGSEEWLKKELQQMRTGQASPAVLDVVKVDVYGTPMSLKEVASITIEGVRTIRIAPWDKSQLKTIEKAIAMSNLGLSVVIDEAGLRVNFPELTSERRSEVVKIAKEKLEEAKKQIRLYRDTTIKDLQSKERDAVFGKDDVFRYKNDVQKFVDESNKRLEEAFAKKEKEILG